METKKYHGKKEQMIEREKELCKILKTMMDSDANFAKPFSEFWRGCSPSQAPGAFGLFGLWLSGEGGSKINGKNVADYYDKETFEGIKELKNFMKKYELYLDWYDPGTIMILFK